jgi:hypothetical protein
VTTTEDRLRELFAGIEAPDVTPARVDVLRHKARAHRFAQLTGALSCVAVVAAAIFGGVALSGGSGRSPATKAINTPAHIPGVTGKQVLIAQQQLDGRTYQAASYVLGDRTCIITTTGGQWCATQSWQNEVADDDYARSGDVVAVLGRVPLSAKVVVVSIDNFSKAVPAVLTTTSNHERFFAAFLRVPLSYNPVDPFVGVFNALGQAVPPPGGAPAPTISAVHSKVPWLPSDQYEVVSSSDGWKVITYRQGAQNCLTIVSGARQSRTTCEGEGAEAPARLFSRLRLPNGNQLIAGDAPGWARSVIVASRVSYANVTTVGVPDTSGRVFWTAEIAKNTTSPPQRLASCAAGNNCWEVAPF